jgi:hypothetical protein
MLLPGESAADLPWSAAGADGSAFLSTTSGLDHDLDGYLDVHAAPRDVAGDYAAPTVPSMLEAPGPVITAAIVLAAISTASATTSLDPDSES